MITVFPQVSPDQTCPIIVLVYSYNTCLGGEYDSDQIALNRNTLRVSIEQEAMLE